ncbi:carbon-nitrogen hydrolase family protein [Glaciihabitans sp. dw_435]|uniref:carbon-nitrogen hydrolase family protein n=1 Tax=Glaciihabitans sp. dw_435 TaxID=2720081 RepID=UPI001BD277F9|nr:carbon-nitrogen hydrolase family protein [Glaciihabitans sp. dw_435]
MTRVPRELTVAVVQSGSTSPDRATAIADLLDLFETAATPGVDVVVFPELCTTPYFGSTNDDRYKAWAQTIPGPDTDAFAATAKRLGVGVIFGMFELGEDGVGYNSAVVIDGTGTIVSGTTLAGDRVSSYRKMSIPKGQVGVTAVNEKYFFTPGGGTVIFEAFGARFACLICYDRTFPEYWLAARAAGAEVVVALVSSMGSREALFVQELQVRAMETQVYVIAPNRGGAETLGETTTDYFGLSCIATPEGEIVALAAAHTNPEILSATLDLNRVADVREYFDIARDRRGDVFQYLATATA